jgi:adenylate cyclase
MFLGIAAVIYATSQTVRSATVEVLLQLATQNVEEVSKGIEAAAPNAWHKLLANEPLATTDLEELTKAFGNEQNEAHIAQLKVYGRDRKTIFATEKSEIGLIEDKPQLRTALTLGLPSVMVENDAQGDAFYELYIPYRHQGHIAAVFELYEPISGFDALLWKVVRPVLIVPVILFLAMLAALTWLVIRAQSDINRRTGVILSLSNRLERLVSRKAVAAMRSDDPKPAEALDVTLFYSDVRGFTGFAEHHAPKKVIDFLNRIIGLQVEIVEANGGDVDKMIGDAVLARFHGKNGAIRAIQSAIAVQKTIRTTGLSPGLAIGLFSGPVVAGLIGTQDRLDYTVVGDSVNSAARLCDLAKAGEIVADSDTASQGKNIAFGPERNVRVKGRLGKLTIRFLNPDALH